MIIIVHTKQLLMTIDAPTKRPTRIAMRIAGRSRNRIGAVMMELL